MSAVAQKSNMHGYEQLTSQPIANLDNATIAHPDRLDAIVRVLTCGSVDDGKSTLIGRLLWDASDLPDDTRATINRSVDADGVPDVSLLVDGLVAEREQGITIDIAWRYFDAGHRRYVIIDSPGHEQYTRNMATGASHADVAIMLIDARHGVKRQTRRHAAILDLMGVRRVILAVNKMDLIIWSEEKFRAIERDVQQLVRRFNFIEAAAIPVAAKRGDNVARRSDQAPWYHGQTLIERLSEVSNRDTAINAPFRFPVQSIIRDGLDFRGLSGAVATGSIQVGKSVQLNNSGATARIRRIVTMDGDLDIAVAGNAVVLQLDADYDVSRGAILAEAAQPPIYAQSLQARLVWLAETPLDTDHGLLIRTSTDLTPVSSLSVTAKLDLETLAENPATICLPNDVFLADISTSRPIAIDRFSDVSETGCFVLVDALSGSTLACGVVVQAHEHVLKHPSARPSFTLSVAQLEREICAGLSSSSDEFHRRANAVARILESAGLSVDIKRD